MPDMSQKANLRPNHTLSQVAWSTDSAMLCTIGRGDNDYCPSFLTVWKFNQRNLQSIVSIISNIWFVEWTSEIQFIAWDITEGSNALLFYTLHKNELKLTDRIEFNTEKNLAFGHAFDENMNHLVIAFRDRTVLVIDLVMKSTRNEFKVQTNTQLWSILWLKDDRNLLYHVTEAKYGIVSAFGDGQDVHHIEGYYGVPYALHWDSENQFFWSCTGEGIALTELQGEVHTELWKHRVAGCGVKFSPDGLLIASGDLGGWVSIWSLELDSEFIRFQVDTSVRTINWWGTSVVLVGCMDGLVYAYNIKTESLRVVLAMSDVINAMEWENKAIPERIAVVTSAGRLLIAKAIPPFMYLRVTHCITAHEKVEKDDVEFKEKFGSLHLQADIWSVCWSSDNSFIATGSEDQTVKLFDSRTLKHHRTLKDYHTTAVTAVTWHGDYFVSCGDDRKVILFNTNSWEIIKVLITDEVPGWHTLSYCTMHFGNRMIFAGTEHGYLIAWDIDRDLYKAVKVHNGSIEGIDMYENFLVTCSSDCNVFLFLLE